MRKANEAIAQPDKHLYVVLGMHRSGTSAITRGLQVLGIQLGSRLMPPVANNNEKGFFEDIDIYNLNVELLKMEGHDWNTVSPIDLDKFSTDSLSELKKKAADLLQQRFSDTDTYGLKEPRMARLLPFWAPIFKQLQLDVKYIIVVRNPLSVARSLANRDGLPAEKSYYLWLEHLVPSLMLTKGAPRVVVDYDRLLDNPRHELTRISQRLNMAVVLDEERFAEYQHGFLEEGLRHARYWLDDLEQEQVVPVPVRESMHLLDALARDELSIEDASVDSAFQNYCAQLEAMSPAFGYIDSLNRMVKERDARMEGLNHELAGKEQTVAERDGQIVELNQALADNSRHIAHLENTAAERDRHIAHLENTVAERDRHIAFLKVELVERDNGIRNLSDDVSRLKQILSNTQASLDLIENCLVWRLVRPISSLWRYIGNRFLHRFFGFRLIANEQLRPFGVDGRSWESMGTAPSFLMLPNDGSYPAGWILLNTRVKCDGCDLALRLYWDTGEGFSDSNSIAVPISLKGNVVEVFQLPPAVQGLRWAPMHGPGKVVQGPIRIYQISAVERVVLMLIRVLPMFWKQSRMRRKKVGLLGYMVVRDLQGAYRAAGEIRNYRSSNLNA